MTEITDYFLAVYLLAMGEEMAALQVQPKEIFGFAESPSLHTTSKRIVPTPLW